MKYPSYFDYASTTPVDPRVLEVMLPYFSGHFGNASSRFHAYGWKAQEAIEKARQQVSDLIHAHPKEIIFTGGATESVNLALKGTFEAYGGQRKHIISLKTEHKAVLDTLRSLEKRGAEITLLESDSEGLPDLSTLESAIRPDTLMLSVMWVNNETGVIQDMEKISGIAAKHKVFLHTDATQAVGKISTDVRKIPADLLSFSGHKIYGPKGTGVLYCKSAHLLQAQHDGGGHERGRRSGTLNVSGIAGLGQACEVAGQTFRDELVRLNFFRDDFEKFIAGAFPFCHVNGSSAPRFPGISNITFRGLDGEELLMRLHDIAISNGSACNSASTEPSHVLKAMALPDDEAYSSLRFSFGRFTSTEELEKLKIHLKEVVDAITRTVQDFSK